MTRLTKPLTREVEGVSSRGGKPDTLVVTLSREGLVLRIKGTRHSYPPLSYGTLLFRAAQMEADEITRQRRVRALTRKAAS